MPLLSTNRRISGHAVHTTPLQSRWMARLLHLRCPVATRLRLQRIRFVELTPFVTFREIHWTDEDLQQLQGFLLVHPLAGDLIRGGGGLRKIRWSAKGRGKRGGARVVKDDLTHG
jgi:hypothetical protein